MKNGTVYLGDGVYCCIENGMIKLWTSNGVVQQNVIYLELEVYTALTSFVNQAIARGQEALDEMKKAAGEQ